MEQSINEQTIPNEDMTETPDEFVVEETSEAPADTAAQEGAETPADDVAEQPAAETPADDAAEQPAAETPAEPSAQTDGLLPAMEEQVKKLAAEQEVHAQTIQQTEEPLPDPKKEPSGVLGVAALLLLLAACAAAVWVLYKKGMFKKRPSKPVDDQIPVTEILTPSGEYTGPKVAVGMAQTIGARSSQQDSMYLSDWKDASVLATRGVLAAVADGIGGLNDGDVASNTAMRTMRSHFASDPPYGSLSDRLLDLAAAAQKEVLELNRKGGGKCGSTLVSVLISGWQMVFLSIGDSRIYLCRSGAFLQLNREHNYGPAQQEQQALDQAPEHGSGKAAALTSFVGKENLKLIDRCVRPINLLPGDRLVLMSDGVYGTLPDEEMLGFMRMPPDEAAKAIIQAVEGKKKKNQDNASVLVVHVQ